MAIKLVTKNDNISLTTGGVPQSEINGLLAAQEKRLEDKYGEQINGLNAEIDGLEAEVSELQAIVDTMPIPVEGVEF